MMKLQILNIKKYLAGVMALLIVVLYLFIPKAGYGQGRCLIVSDIHLNSLTEGEYKSGADANITLLKQALDNMYQKIKQPDFIIIAGDFIGHNFKGNKDEIINTVFSLFHDKFKGVPVIPALGNNDSYGGDYVKQDTAFLSHFAKAWMPGNNLKLDTDFKKSGGYYAATIVNHPKLAGLKFIVLNTTLVSDRGHRYWGTDARTTYCEGDMMLKWLDNIFAKQNNSKAWLIYHMPPGIDSYQQLSNLNTGKNYDTLLWDPAYSQRFVNTVTGNATQVKFSIAGHVHRNDFRVFCNASGAPVSYTRVVSSISPNYGNNPSFEIADFDKDFNVLKETTYYIDLSCTANPQNDTANRWKEGYSINTVEGLATVNSNTLFSFAHKYSSNNPKITPVFINFYNTGACVFDCSNLNITTYKTYFNHSILTATH